jgi:predicted dehydrogenase
MKQGAIVGIGKIAQTGHLLAFNDEHIASQAAIVAAVDPNPVSRQRALEKFPYLRCYETLTECCKKEQIDFVDICAPPHLHSTLIKEAVQRSLNILCEKPFALNQHEASQLAELLRNHPDIIFIPCHQYRNSLIWKHLYEFKQESGTSSGWFIEFSVFRTEADPGLLGGTTSWRTQLSISGGGIIADTGVHYLYLCYWIMGMPKSVTVRTQKLYYTAAGVEDTAEIILEYPDGVARINLTWAADRRANSARMITRNGSIIYDGAKMLKYSGDRSGMLSVPDASDKTQYVAMYVQLIGEFLKQTASGRQNDAWIDEAYQSVRILEMCYRSATEGKTLFF